MSSHRFGLHQSTSPADTNIYDLSLTCHSSPPFSVYQLTLLEVDYNGTDTPTGVVLALVGSCREDESTSKDVESSKSLRMYSLSSIISLAKWAGSNKVALAPPFCRETAEMTPNLAYFQYVQPLRLRGSTPGNPHRGSVRKGYREPRLGITKGLKSLSIDNQAYALSQPFSPFRNDCLSPIPSSPGVSPSTSSVNSVFVDDLRGSRASLNPTRSMDSVDSTWDVVEDLPLRWALDYVSLAISGSRLANTSVLFYDIWADSANNGRKGALLAVATKSTILLYETPRGERAFRFVKVSRSSQSRFQPHPSHSCCYGT